MLSPRLNSSENRPTRASYAQDYVFDSQRCFAIGVVRCLRTDRQENASFEGRATRTERSSTESQTLRVQRQLFISL